MKKILFSLSIILLIQTGLFAQTSIDLSTNPNTDPQGWEFTITLQQPAGIKVICKESTAPYETHVIKDETATTIHKMTIHGLKANTSYNCLASLMDNSSKSNTISITTEPLPQELQSFGISQPFPDDAYMIVPYRATISSYAYYYIIFDRMGNIRWYLPIGNTGWIDADVNYDPASGTALAGGSMGTILPQCWTLDKKLIWKKSDPVNHDFGLSTDKKSIFALMSNSDNTTVKILQYSITDGSIIWSWNFVTDGGLTMPNTNTGFHQNAIVDRWENGRLYLYVSIKADSRIIKIDYISKKILWTLGKSSNSFTGDFTLLEKDGAPSTRWFYGQHDVRMIGNSNFLTMFDNQQDDIGNKGTASRLLQLQIDEIKKTARIVFEYTLGSLNYGGGSMELLADGNYLASQNDDIFKVSPDGKLLWKTQVKSNVSKTVYRVHRLASTDIFNKNFSANNLFNKTTAIPSKDLITFNTPNPFNPTTTIRYELSHNAYVKLTVYNMIGQEVRTLVNSHQSSGIQSVVWDGKNDAGQTLSSGIYFYRLETPEATKTIKMTLLK